MPADRPIQNGALPRPQPFQFTLRSLLVAMTLTAIFLSCLFGGPVWIAAFAVLLVILAAPVALVTIVVYGHGYQRTFCVGALTSVIAFVISPAAIPYVFFFDVRQDFQGIEPRCYALIGLLVGALIAAAFGLLAILVRRMVEPVPSASERHPDGPTDDDCQDPFG